VPARLIRALVLILVAGMVTAPDALAETELDEAAGNSMRFVDVEIEPDEPIAGSVATVRFTIEDEYGNAITGLRASGLLRAPSTIEDDSPPSPSVTTIGRELSEPGRYEVAVALNQSGRWWLEVRVNNEIGQIARYDHFTTVDAIDEPVPATTSDPIFLRGDGWDAFYRIDPDTGSVAELDGMNLFEIGDRWWIANFTMQERGNVSSNFGGTWRLSVELRDAITGNGLTRINLGDVRANVYGGSTNDPAIATAMTIADDGSAAYIYWARQLGDGWVSHIVEADPLTGEVRNDQVLNGAISSNGFWAEIYLREDGQVLVAEQVVELASVSGYRLTLLERGSLDVVEQFRRTDAREDPLTHCILPYPGPVGEISGDQGHRFSLCSPPDREAERALLVWDPVTGEPESTIELDDLTNPDSGYTDGVASPTKSTFYAVNTRSLQIAEIDLADREVIRERNMLPDEGDDSSTIDRFFDWVFGSSSEPTEDSTSVEPGVAISPGGETLYVIANPENREPGIMVVDVETLEIIDSLKTGEPVDGLITTSDGRIVVIQHGENGDGDSVTVLDQDGNTRVSFTLPGRSDVAGIRQ
jgi:DNA-binding beta-propeller fold protein YncE